MSYSISPYRPITEAVKPETSVKSLAEYDALSGAVYTINVDGALTSFGTALSTTLTLMSQEFQEDVEFLGDRLRGILTQHDEAT